MTRPAPKTSGRPLVEELARFVRLRWTAGGVVLVGSLAERHWMRWYAHEYLMAAIGALILAYNFVLFVLVRRARLAPRGSALPLALAWAQLSLDLACLTAIVLLTGGVESPLLCFFVFHMVFASILLPRRLAYAGGGVALLLMGIGLGVTGSWPTRPEVRANLVTWCVTLIATVWLANRITRNLRAKRRRLVRQNRRIRGMSQTLRRQQQAMIQHEKMVAAGQMAAGVAHEIANPLASMDGLLQNMERRPEKARPEAISTLREQVARINQIVRRMTAFAHPGDGQSARTLLNDVVEKSLEVIRFDPRLKRVVLRKELADGMPPVTIIPHSIQQVLINLVINALDAMEGVESPMLTIRTAFGGGHCTLEVIDNGHGISPEQRRHLFEPFFTTKPVGKGTGLGLSISYSLVRQHGGEVMVDSKGEGKGAHFIVRLPADAPAAAHAAPAVARVAGAAASATPEAPLA